MNTNALETLLVQTLTEMKSGAEKVGNFAIEQAPDVFQQLLAYQFWSSAIFGVLLGIIALALAWLAIAIAKRYDDGTEATAILPGFFCLVALAGCLALGNKALKIKVAPKVYVIEYTTRLVRGR